jgi:hypothetical protein
MFMVQITLSYVNLIYGNILWTKAYQFSLCHVHKDRPVVELWSDLHAFMSTESILDHMRDLTKLYMNMNT